MYTADGNIQALAQAVLVVELLAGTVRWFALTEIADSAGISKPRAYRILQTLTALDYVKQDMDSHKYALGVRAILLGSAASRRLDVREVAAPLIRALRDETRETIHLSIYSAGEVIYVDKVESTMPVAAQSYIGGHAPAYCLATGRALLAFQDDDEIQRVLSGSLQRFTSRTVTDKRRLLALLSAVRQHGYAVNRGAWRDGVCGVAAPIRDSRGKVVASVGISAPERRFNTDSKRYVQEVLSTASRISRQLGHLADDSPNGNSIARSTNPPPEWSDSSTRGGSHPRLTNPNEASTRYPHAPLVAGTPLVRNR